MPSINDVQHGEIVVRYKTDQPELLIKIDSGDSETFATFKDSVAVSGMIVNAITGATGDITDLQSKVNNLSSATDTFINTTAPDTYLTKTDALSIYVGQSAMTDYYTKEDADGLFLSQSAASTTYATSADVVSAIEDVAGDLDDLTSTVGQHTTAIQNLTTGLSATVVSDYSTTSDMNTAIGNASAASVTSAKDYTDSVISNYATSANVVSAITVEKERAEGIESGLRSDVNTLTGQMQTITAENGLSATVIADHEIITGITTTYETKEDATAKYNSAVTYVDTVSGNIETYIKETYWTSAETQDQLTGITQDISNVSGSVVATSANVITLSGDVVSYVDTKISSVYRYKGSKDTYEELTGLTPSDNVVGDVWNVVAANGTIGTADYVPAGTNYAWNGSEWDALGGTVDLSTYATKDYVDGKTSGITSMVSDISTLQTNLGTLSGSVSGFSGQVVNNYYTKTNADSLFLSQSAASETYLTQTDASDTYLSKSAASNTYLTITSADSAFDTVTTDISDLSGATETIETKANNSISAVTTNEVTAATNTTNTEYASGVKINTDNEGRGVTFDFSELVIDCGDF